MGIIICFGILYAFTCRTMYLIGIETERRKWKKSVDDGIIPKPKMKPKMK